MICRSCLRRAFAPHPAAHNSIKRPLSISSQFLSPETPPARDVPPRATSTGIAQPFSTPLSPRPNEVSLGQALKPKLKGRQIPASMTPAGTTIKGLNYIKGRDDPVALPEEQYPEWLWTCLDEKVIEGKEDAKVGDQFSKSKRIRRKAAKAQRKVEAKLLASGNTDALRPKVPISKQTIDLPANEGGTAEGALAAEEKRQELRAKMRMERRAKIKEDNFLSGIRGS